MSDPHSDSLVNIPDLPIRLPVFEGPLDLLLFLIRRNEVDIYDIPIVKVTQQYTETLREMKQMDLEVAGEFFVMASTLMYIKSRMLLPKDDQGEDASETDGEDLDPRWELVQQLIEYRKFKETAAVLDNLIAEAQTMIPREFLPEAEELAEERPIKQSDRITLWGVFNQVLRRLSESMVVGEIHDEIVTVSDRMEYILQVLDQRPRFFFTDLFEERITPAYLISTFIALLELTRLGNITIEQSLPFADIACFRRDASAAPTTNYPS